MNLLAAAGGAWILDAIFFGILLIGLIIGALRGFVRSIAKMAGTIFSFIVAFLFCIQFSALLENWFHLTTALAGAIKNAKIAYWLCVALSFILLVILTKLAAWLLGKLGKSIVHRSKLLGAVDRILGALLGFAKAFMLILVVMVIFKLIGIESVDSFIRETLVVGKLYFSRWPEFITSLPSKFIQGQNAALAMLVH